MDTYEKIDDYKKLSSGHLEEIKNQNAEIEKMYLFLKEKSREFYIDGKFHPDYATLVAKVQILEGKLPVNEYIIRAATEVKQIIKTEFEDCSNKAEVLDYLVYEVKKYLLTDWYGYTDIHNNKISFENYCPVASKKLKKLCDSLKIKSHIIKIHPGYNKQERLFGGSGFHMCNILEIDKKYYLVDCTYRQFFTIVKNNLQRIGIPYLFGCKVGTFMLMNENRKQVATKLLRDGWIELNEEVLKHYLDGFSISFRNGLYYEETGDISFTTNYSANDYEKFLIGEDDQIRHEGKKVLGYQTQPLKNYNMKLK